jgi:hypothetical protein
MAEVTDLQFESDLVYEFNVKVDRIVLNHDCTEQQFEEEFMGAVYDQLVYLHITEQIFTETRRFAFGYYGSTLELVIARMFDWRSSSDHGPCLGHFDAMVTTNKWMELP